MNRWLNWDIGLISGLFECEFICPQAVDYNGAIQGLTFVARWFPCILALPLGLVTSQRSNPSRNRSDSIGNTIHVKAKTNILKNSSTRELSPISAEQQLRYPKRTILAV